MGAMILLVPAKMFVFLVDPPLLTRIHQFRFEGSSIIPETQGFSECLTEHIGLIAAPSTCSAPFFLNAFTWNVLQAMYHEIGNVLLGINPALHNCRRVILLEFPSRYPGSLRARCPPFLRLPVQRMLAPRA